MYNITQISRLLKDVNQLQQHQKEIEKIKGETFNIFSILGVETKENKTHSSFLAELLNPKGSHYMGDIFLDAFLKQIKYEDGLNIKTSKIIKEFHVGKKNNITGGRIDILIQDKSGHHISIENKIHAGDQENQLIRYYNYKKGRNKLYYLSLFGKEATEMSTAFETGDKKIKLEEGKDYIAISYSKDILEWLNTCFYLSIEAPQLRDSIKQYILLIKKLTNQMIDPKSLDIKKKLFEFSESAEYISKNFQNIKNDIKDRFREDVAKELRSKTDTILYNYAHPNPVDKKGYAQIFVELKKYPDSGIQILIESFSGFGNLGGKMYIGVFDHSGKREDFPKGGSLDGFKTTIWKNVQIIKIDNEFICFEDVHFLEELVDPSSTKYKKILDKFVDQCVNYINKNYVIIDDYLNRKTNKN